MGTTHKLTLKKVAERLKVSTATISNAFNRPDQLSSDLRERILSECEAIGYFGPNAAARSLRTGRTGIVGIVLYDRLSYSVSDPVASQFLKGMAEVLDAQEYNMLLLSSNPTGQDAQIRMQAFMVDGFIVYGYNPKQQANAPWLSPNKNVVAVDSKSISDCPSVNVDNYEGAKKIALHALQYRPQRVAILGLSLLDTNHVCRIQADELYDEAASISVQRLHGYFDALLEHDYKIGPEDIWNIPVNTHRAAYQAAREALMMINRPQLLLCMSDRIAIAAVQVALQLGLRVPEDLKVVGFDGIPEASNIHPSITTIHQQNEEKGKIAAELFLGLRQDKDVVLTTELMVRESCP